MRWEWELACRKAKSPSCSKSPGGEGRLERKRDKINSPAILLGPEKKIIFNRLTKWQVHESAVYPIRSFLFSLNHMSFCF
jgi:hypothetical protein